MDVMGIKRFSWQCLCAIDHEEREKYRMVWGWCWGHRLYQGSEWEDKGFCLGKTVCQCVLRHLDRNVQKQWERHVGKTGRSQGSSLWRTLWVLHRFGTGLRAIGEWAQGQRQGLESDPEGSGWGSVCGGEEGNVGYGREG